MDSTPEVVAFEHPLNERTRSFLRLQFLLAELEHHRRDTSDWGRRASMRALLDTLSVLGRSDFKNELLKDLGERYAALQRDPRHSGGDAIHARELMQRIGQTQAALHRGASAQPAALLRESDFLYAIHSRSAIPGGTCEFDLPVYHRWLCRSQHEMERDLDQWSARVLPYKSAVDLSLQLLRDSGRSSEHVAAGGVFLQVPQTTYSLIRVQVAAAADVYPEISASKHRIAVRFMSLGDVNSRNVQALNDQPFLLQCCTPPGVLPP